MFMMDLLVMVIFRKYGESNCKLSAKDKKQPLLTASSETFLNGSLKAWFQRYIPFFHVLPYGGPT